MLLKVCAARAKRQNDYRGSPLAQPSGGGAAPWTRAWSGSAEAGSDVAGFSILQADNIEAVVKILGSHPHLQMPGAGIEIHETLSFPGGM